MVVNGGYNTDYKSSEPLKTLFVLSYVKYDYLIKLSNSYVTLSTYRPLR